MNARMIALCVALLCGSLLSAIAGSPAGTAQIGPTDNSSISTYKVTATGPGMSARDSAGSGTGQTATSASSQGTSSTGSSYSSGTGSSFDAASSSSSAHGSSSSSANSASNRAINGPWRSDLSFVSGTKLQTEKVIDTRDKPLFHEKTAKVESKDNTFAPGLLDAISVASNPTNHQASNAPKNEDPRFKTKLESFGKDDSKKH